MRRLNKIFTLVLISIFASCKESKTYTFNENDIKIIPQPAEMLLKTGAFEFTNSTKIVAMNPDQIQIAGFFIDRLKTASGMNLEIVDATPSANYIEFVAAESLADEAYELLVQEDKITIKSASNAGFLYAMESIRQLLPIAVESKSVVENTDWVIPNIEIKDQPRYKYRGLMLDVSRHFFEIDYLKKTVDRLAMLKMNVLHLHLI